MLELREQVQAAVNIVKAMFAEAGRESAIDVDSLDAEQLRAKVRELEAELSTLKRKMRGAQARVTVEAAAKAILVDPRLPNLSKELVAEVLRTVFAHYGAKCSTTPESVGWYITKYTRDWNIVPRRPPQEAIYAVDGSEGKDA